MIQESHFCRFCLAPFDDDPFTQSIKRFRGRNTFHLHKVGPWMVKGWLRQPMLDDVIVGEQEKSFAIGIQAAYGIHIARERPVIFQ